MCLLRPADAHQRRVTTLVGTVCGSVLQSSWHGLKVAHSMRLCVGGKILMVLIVITVLS